MGVVAASSEAKRGPEPPRHSRATPIVLDAVALLAALIGGALLLFVHFAPGVDGVVLIGAGAAVLSAILLRAANVALRRGDERAAAIRITLALVAAGAVAATFSPQGTVFVALLPVLAAAIILPFVRGRALFALFIGCGVAGAMLLAWTLVWTPPARLPRALDLGVRIAGYAALLALTLALLHRHHARLTGLVRQVQQEHQVLEKAHRELDETHQALRVAHERVEESSRTLQQAHRRLERSDRSQGRFFNAAAHDLRTPLTPIVLHFELLRNRPTVEQDPQLQRSLEVIDRNLIRMKTCVDNLLDIARFQKDQYTFQVQTEPLGPLFGEVRRTFADIAAANGIRFHVDDADIKVRADSEAILHVLFNIITTALDAAPEGERVHVFARTSERTCRVYVVHTGRGYSEKELAQIFQPFAETQAGPGVAGGGLGLYIARRIIEGHGGELRCASPGPERGAVFTFTLPLAAPSRTGDTLRETLDPEAPPVPP